MAVQVGVFMQQVLGQDVVGHDREVKAITATPRRLEVGTAVSIVLPLSL